MTAADDTFTSSHSDQAPVRLAAGGGHRTILTSAASNFRRRSALPPGVAASGTGIDDDAGDIGKATP